jgi:hypothetical protein
MTLDDNWIDDLVATQRQSLLSGLNTEKSGDD